MSDYQKLISNEPESKTVKEIKKQILSILNGEKTRKDVLEEFKGNENFPQDIKTLNACIETSAINDEQIKDAYLSCKKRSEKNDYVVPICYMLLNDLSIHETANIFKISRDTLKGAIIRAKKTDPDLEKLINEHNVRHTMGKYYPKLELNEEELKKEKEIIRKFISTMKEKNEDIKKQAPSTVRRKNAKILRREQIER